MTKVPDFCTILFIKADMGNVKYIFSSRSGFSNRKDAETGNPAFAGKGIVMKHFTRKTAVLLIGLLFIGTLLPACGKEKKAEGAWDCKKYQEDAIRDSDLKIKKETEDNARVFYEIFVGSFSDSNGDGIGDLRGIINHMDYLNDGDPNSGMSLGVEGIWLTPIFKSPTYHKYDAMDYYEIDPDFGTEEDLKELIALCHKRNVKLILDLVINHTAYRNKWFSNFVIAHRTKDTESEFYNFYTWYREGDPVPQGRAFKKIEGSDDYYECNFWEEMPELNFDEPAVRQAVLDIAKYYLDLGIDGFRFDAAKYVYFGDNGESAEFWEWYIAELKKLKPDIYTVAEVWDADSITDQYYPAMNCFNFTMSQQSGLIADAASNGSAGKLAEYTEKYLDNVHKLNADAMIIPFITNHDQDRAAGFLPVSNGRMYVAASLLILSPGSPFIYYGEEIGMKGSRGGSNTDSNRRLAMRWGDGDTVKNPEGSTYEDSKQVKTTALDQIRDSGSIYSHYKHLIMLRKANPEIARGEYKAVKISNSRAGGFISTYEGSSVLVLHNPSDDDISVDLANIGDGHFKTIRGSAGLNGAALEGTKLTIGPMTSVVLK